jgi:hypothetical protein
MVTDLKNGISAIEAHGWDSIGKIKELKEKHVVYLSTIWAS